MYVKQLTERRVRKYAGSLSAGYVRGESLRRGVASRGLRLFVGRGAIKTRGVNLCCPKLGLWRYRN